MLIMLSNKPVLVFGLKVANDQFHAVHVIVLFIFEYAHKSWNCLYETGHW